ncbi:MAG: cell division ATP-binding protein FtsE [Halothiobacillus sp. 24-54-40]|jgi:cell division transport system ATP-binding protein|nr:cell division ATP-binding protein FtsE [Halothiobacillaceae bacterium]OYV45043.1 MAG: cell division ATP-binding protein FtsE [Halothiobacillus sp. 20-53-49]OYY33743.1 MAG: cell division ATP-binding protein FtsE [Halothiobacillus sp. 35-54-62]OYZ87820.1 MAG: cell division ATP-binding protein FtsE [Halothiobacillus sp. 24-54-40]OZA80049.1 MAG: cell division ATP-binding protein FtsE [Halothiobacillus sp. 39-53-45]HQS01988.1 cell division ATP-binding protein FtsE [Halothiobacillus sp.]
MIEFDGVSRRFSNGHFGLQEVSFHIPEGRMVFITGHSGSGKSTLLRLIPALDQPTSGIVRIGGHDLKKMPPHQYPKLRRQIGVVFQDHHLLPNRRVFDNVALPLQVTGFLPADIRRRAEAALDKVGLLDRQRARIDELSGGEQQRVNIARALVNRPKILLADEPTGNLDPELSREIFNQFAEFHAVGVTVVIASHDVHLLKTYAVPRIVLNQGHISHIEEAF